MNGGRPRFFPGVRTLNPVANKVWPIFGYDGGLVRSTAIYYGRLRRARNLRDGTMAAIVTAPVLLLMLKLPSGSRKKNDAQEDEEADAV